MFDSTSDLSGRDTGISQIWFLSAIGFPQILTYGQGPSRRPAISSDGRVIAFESTADLTGNLQDTMVSQIFLYDADKGSLIRVTDDPAGCSGASVSAVPRDISVGYACDGKGFFYHYLAGKHFQLPTDGGNTAQAVADLGSCHGGEHHGEHARRRRPHSGAPALPAEPVQADRDAPRLGA